jgi:hypothetical protein
MRSATPRRILAAALLAATGLASAEEPARAQGAPLAGGPLASPGAYDLSPGLVPGSGSTGSLLPGPSAGGIVPKGGVASVGFGSRGMQSSAIRLDSGPLGGNSTQAFLALGQGQGPSFAGGRLRGQSAAVGVESRLGDGFRIGLGVSVEHDRWTQAR